MKTSYRLEAAAAGAGIFPVAVFAALDRALGAGPAAAASGAAAALGAWCLASYVKSGLTRPMDKMAEERAKAQALIEAITDGILLLDGRGHVIYSNQLALNLLGIPGGQPDIELPASAKQKEFQPALAAIMASDESYYRTEVTAAGPAEECPAPKTFSVLSRQFFLAALKSPVRLIHISDVTIGKELDTARETFFHMITHDMRAPLTSIQGYAQMLARALPAMGQKNADYLQSILRSAQRLDGMVTNILNTMKLERGDPQLNISLVDARALCAGVYEVHEPLAARRKITLRAAELAQKIEFAGNKDLLDRVLSNLVDNSLKFTPPGGAVAIACRADGGEVVFSVEDTGPGVPKEKQKEIFEKYTQLEAHKHMGLGLGLAICRLAVERHKGRIWIESQEGKGSRFLFAVPLEQPAA